jgi:hypothetical protein
VFRNPDTPPTFTYHCTFDGGVPTVPASRSALIAFTSRVASCLGVAAPEIDQSAPSGPDPIASLVFRPFRLPYAPAEVTIRLEFLPDGGDGILSLNIGKAK